MKRILFALTVIFLHLPLLAQVKHPVIPKVNDAGDEERRAYEFSRTVDPKTHNLPENIRQHERDFISHLPVRDPFVSYKGKGNEILATSWHSVGPNNQPGRIDAIGIDVKNSNNILAGSASGGMWRTIDRGASWVKVTPPNEEQTISSVAQDTRETKTATWYYGTSELLSTTDRRHTTNIRTHSNGNGIYKSSDNGATWNPLASTQTRNGNIAPVEFTGVWSVVTEYHNAFQDMIYAACYGGIMRSSDGGATWLNVLGSTTLRCFNSDIVIGTNGTLYAALGSTYDGTPSPKQGIWSSINGVEWTKINDASLPALFRRIKLAVAPSNDSILYSFIEAPNFWITADADFNTKHTLLRYEKRSTEKWEDFTATINKSVQGIGNFTTLTGYCMAMIVHPHDPNLVMFSGSDLYRSFVGLHDTSEYLVIGGYPYTLADGDLHPDIHALAFDPADEKILFVATDGGIFSTNDYRSSVRYWQSYFNGLGGAQFYDAKLDDASSGDNFIVGGLQDNSSYYSHSATFGSNWDVASGGDGMTVGIVSGKENFITSSQWGHLYFFGYGADTLAYFGHAYPQDQGLNFAFFTNFIVNPYNHNTLFLAQANNIWRLDLLESIPEFFVDNASWTPYYNIADSIGAANVITAFGMTTGSTQYLYLGTSNGKLYRLNEDEGKDGIPENITSLLFPADGYISHIEVDTKNAGHIIVVFSNYNVQSIFRTTDNGVSWQAASGNLESTADGTGFGPSIRSVRMLHTSNGILYFAATSSGLVSTDRMNGMNTVWTKEAETTIGNLICENIDVRESDGRVIVATQGGGVFSNGGPTAVHQTSETSVQHLTVEQNFPNPVKTSSRIRFHLTSSANVRAELFDALGRKTTTLDDARYDAGDHVIEVSLTKELRDLSAGAYFYRITAGSEVVTRMMMVR